MDTYDRSHLDDDCLETLFDAHAADERGTLAALLADIAEIDARHLFLKSGLESMKAYCMERLHLSEAAAAKRVHVARLARELPALFPAIADGRLHLTAIYVLASRLNRANVEEWIAAAAKKKVGEIEVLLAHRFAQAEVLRFDDGVSPQVVVPQRPDADSHTLKYASCSAPSPTEVAPRVRTKIAPISPERYTLQVTLSGETHDTLRRVQELLGHAVPSGDVAEVLRRALQFYLCSLEKRKFGATKKANKPRPAATQRGIPSRTRRAVYERDAGRCVFVDKQGRRCGSTSRLEFDHIQPVARGGKSTVENLRLVCRAHNQHAAERAFGREFMQRFRH
jgi:HNH endonuclease/Domain of unknown function (DUF222)